MSLIDVIDLASEDETSKSDGEERGLDSVSGTAERTKEIKVTKVGRKSKNRSPKQRIEYERCLNATRVVQSEPSMLATTCSPPSHGSKQICRQFWKAGNYYTEHMHKVPLQRNGKNHLQVHPMFLHSNATSHTWVFGAIAELLDNAVDEIQNGATFVLIDKTINPRDGSTSLLIKDDGGGMDPEAIRRCMSFGFSDKKFGIGQYGNGFKTSSMRLGADAIIFTSHSTNRTMTQSVGLLSLTFLRQTGHDRIVVPLVDYEFDTSSKKSKPMLIYGSEHFSSNLSTLLQWSPYSTEELLLKQFDDIGNHGTKIVIYNLWLNGDGNPELDFDFDSEDIRINVDAKIIQTGERANPVADRHIANLYRYSLRIYTSILYLRLPETFRIILRGRVVEHHNIANDLNFPEFILYKPQFGGNKELVKNLRGTCITLGATAMFSAMTFLENLSEKNCKALVITTIGFLKDVRDVNMHGFNVYHRNRLILPFWSVVKDRTSSCARGVVGILEANFIDPTHNKQDFEKTPLFQKLEARLREMAIEYWDLHCELIGYQSTKKSRSASVISKKSPLPGRHICVEEPVFSSHTSYVRNNPKSASAPTGRRSKAKQIHAPDLELQRQAGSLSCANDMPHNQVGQVSNCNEIQLQDEEMSIIIRENHKLRSRLSELERSKENLNLKVQQLKTELGELERQYKKMMAELESIVKLQAERYGQWHSEKW